MGGRVLSAIPTSWKRLQIGNRGISASILNLKTVRRRANSPIPLSSWKLSLTNGGAGDQLTLD